MNESLPLAATNGTELVSTDENELSGDAAQHQPVGRPTGRVGLVGQSDLHVFDIARNPRIGEPRRVRRAGRDVDDLGQVLNVDRSQACHHGFEEPADVRLLGIDPLRDRDEVDLATIEAVGHNSCLETSLPKAFHCLCGSKVECSVLLHAGRAPFQELRPLPGDLKDLRTSVATQEEVASSAGPRLELAVHVLHVGAAHNEEVNTRIAQGFDALPSFLGIHLAIGHHGAVPVKNEGVEGLLRERRPATRRKPARARRARRHWLRAWSTT